MRAPLLFLIFNRPDTTGKVFEAIRAARPPRLYIAADGPRPEKPGEAELCAEARETALRVDWPCAIKTLFRKRNLGCATAVSSAVTWFFSREPEGVILEDDILPHPDFFPFCEELLEKYRDDPRVMHISGKNFQLGIKRGEASYYFSRFADIWGWASWARAWKHFDLSMPGLKHFIHTELPRVADEPAGLARIRVGLETAARTVNTWDYPWSYSVLKKGGLCVMPNHNLTLNIGFCGGTNCLSPSIWGANRMRPMPEIIHPAKVEQNREADTLTLRLHFVPESPEIFINEGLRRLENGQERSNLELIAAMRDHYGDFNALTRLEALTAKILALKEGVAGKTAARPETCPGQKEKQAIHAGCGSGTGARRVDRRTMPAKSCWCGNRELLPWGGGYLRCPHCETLTDAASLTGDEGRKESGLYGEDYWTGKMAAAYAEMGCSSLDEVLILHYHERAAHWLSHIVRHVLPPARIFEMGCGMGTLVRWLCDLGYAAVGTEMSPAWRRRLREKPGIRAMSPAAFARVFRGVNFDCAILMDVLEHLSDPLAELKKIRKLLKPEGLLILQLPEYPAGASYGELAGHAFLRMLLPGEHVFLYSRAALTRLLHRFGFTHVKWLPKLFPADMFVIAGTQPLPRYSGKEISGRLLADAKNLTAFAALNNYLLLQEEKASRDEVVRSCDAALKKISQGIMRVPQHMSV
ncbi:MAG: class I SAM-dependent methyltransferase [Desulfovibrio sp.]|jgi:2-polyprenyl-3-methyl-5-hydroxy-6-metoxy-1,4-benzoquinol methylase|nr:class I SAM-dependent methyltransferase [Desulfovibrio sp.]